MKYILAVFTAVALTVFGTGCRESPQQGHEGHDHGHAEHDHAEHGHAGHDHAAHSADVEHTLPVGCAGCIYEQEWAKGCQTAVKIGDRVLLVKGVEFNAHKNGLCKAEKTARITGHAEKDYFAATNFEIQP